MKSRAYPETLLRFALLVAAGPISGCNPAEDPMNQPTAGTGGGTGGGGGGGGGGSGPAPTTCTPMPPTNSARTLQGQYGYAYVTAGGQEYVLQVNQWNSTAAQTMVYGGDLFFKMTVQEANVSTMMGPAGYPSIFIGENSNKKTNESHLPMQVSAIRSAPTAWVWNDNGTIANPGANSYNVAYDLWFNMTSTVDPGGTGPTGAYLMVWLHDPSDAQPIGQTRFSNVTIPGVAGQWNVWIGTNGGRPCISYVATQSMLNVSFDLNAFIKDAVQNRAGTVQNHWYLTNVFAGFEIWRGGVNLQTTSYCSFVY